MVRTNTILPVNSGAVSNKIIVIDAGHGLPDAGASSKFGHLEKDLNMEIALKLKKLLKKKGAKVIMTRENDYSLSKSKTNNKSEDLHKRIKIINKAKADIVISIHMNHFSQTKYSGAQTFYSNQNKSSQKLADSIQYNLIKHTDKSNTRKSKESNSIFILKSNTPSVLVECGFLSNEAEAKKLSTKKYQEKIAKSIYLGILDYCNENK